MISIGVKDSLGSVYESLTEALDPTSFVAEVITDLPSDSIDYIVVALQLSGDPSVHFSIADAERLRDWCLAHDKPVILVSSSSVFSGHEQALYLEDNACHPSSTFGKYCLHMEQVFKPVPRLLVLRTGWLFHLNKGNWLGDAIEQFQNGHEIDFPPDQTGNPTSFKDLSRVLLAIIRQLDCADNPALWTTYHYGGVGVVSLHRFCKVVFGELSTVLACPLATIFSSGYDEYQEHHQYGKNTALDCNKILSNFGIKQRSWLQDFTLMLRESFPQPEAD